VTECGLQAAFEGASGGSGGQDLGPVAGAVDVGPAPDIEQADRVGVGDVGLGARPGVGSRFVGETGADGVEVGVGERFDEVRGADRTRIETVLPEVAGGPAEAVEAQSVGMVGLP